MTSIDWLKEQIEQYILTHGNLSFNVLSKFQKQAKEMHKQEIIDAYYQCGKDNFEHIKVINRSATEYYNETYKKD